MSFDIALSGIQAINEALDTTSHNIANAGTYGFKSSRANFSSLVAGDQPTGVMIGSHTQSINQQGGILNTGRSLDASINGRGFFVSRDVNTGVTQYSRVGIFSGSKDGYVVDSNGRRVQGNVITPGTSVKGAQGDLKIQTGAIPAVMTEKMNYVGNLSADWSVPVVAFDQTTATPTTPPDPASFNMAKATVIYDTLGGQHTLTQYFSRASATDVTVNYLVDGLQSGQTTTITTDSNGQMTAPAASPDNGTFNVDLTGFTLANGAKLGSIALNYTGTTGFAGEATTATNNANGYASGTYQGIDLGDDGSIIAKYTNGQKQTIGMLSLATFADEGSLTSVSDTSWIESVASGQPNIDNPGVGMNGTLTVASLEQSNVDITSELVGLMTSQRNYQANSKVIQTESQMMQSLMQAI